jgi:hypothetical protein
MRRIRHSLLCLLFATSVAACGRSVAALVTVDPHTAAIFFIDSAGRIQGIRDDADSDASLAHALAAAAAS